MRDLVVRVAGNDDLPLLCAVNGSPPELVRARLDRGDLGFLGLVRDRVVCKTWFHKGPTPFAEDADNIVVWQLAPTTFWSYDGAAVPEAMATGVFIKMFVDGIRQLFERHGASRVLGTIRDQNRPSLALHDRLGFHRAGTVTTLTVPGWKWVHWHDAAGARQWIVRRGKPFSIDPAPR